ncbi:PQQ-binding-like beta-propeller repeat protein [Spirillospora sp. CA-142024]|uniref:outer membrane protein assembly factor BamB family protein n=1 Tax=Spirillospora sp. CA-142024 TaxID=3240036 RepID=UPI003D8E7DCC
MQRLRPDDPDRVGPYRLLARLGAGGMGVVYLGRSPGGRLVAVKVVSARFTGDAEYRARFEREIGAARTVSGAFTASMLDADADAGTPWLATAYLPGLTLREAVAGHGPFPAPAVRTLAAGLAEALVDIHRAGLTHRDLKPGNIMLTAGGPRVIDFGIARPEDAVTITRVGGTPGTPGFMSPEQAAGLKVGPAGDVFSLGAVLAYAATGAEPFAADGTAAALRRIKAGQADLGGISDPWLRDLIGDCLRLERGRRPSAADLLARLDEAGPAHGAAWLPAGVAEAIGRRTVQARGLPEVAMPPAASATLADRAGSAEETAEPPTTDGDGASGLPAATRVPSRRALLIGGGAALATAGVAAGAATLSRNRDPVRRSAARAATPSATPSPSAPPPRAKSRWKVKVDDYYPDLLAADGVLLAHGDGILKALDPDTGKTRWKHRSVDVDHVSVDGGDVFLVDHFASRLTMLRADSGAERWSRPWPSEKNVPMYPVAGTKMACFGYYSVTALGRKNGRRRWNAPVKAEYGIAVADDVVVVADRTRVAALDAGSGRPRWTYQVEWAHYPQVCYGLVFVLDGPGTVHALRADTGGLVWKRFIGDTVYESFGFGSGGGLVHFGTAAGDVYAIRAATGEVVWSRRLGQGASRNQWNALGITGDTLYAGCADRNVYALGAADGRIKWTYPADVTVRTSAPVAIGGSVFIGTAGGYVKALTPPDGG